MDFERINPMTNQAASKAPAMTPAEAGAVAERAATGFIAWSGLGPNARRATLMKAAAALEFREEDFVAAMMGEIGATAGWAMFNLKLAAGMVREAAALIKPCLLELGGKAPLIVLEDADLDEAVKAAAFGAFMNQGQICMSTERIIVVEAVAGEFVKRFSAKAKSLPSGDPREGKTPLGAVVDTKTVRHVNRLIEDATAKGADITAGGKADSVLMPATVVDGVTASMDIYRDESFGPVVGIIHARDEAHAIRLANDSEYGLSAAVFTRDTARGLRVARQIRSGICHINGPTVHDEPQMPFGGVGASGVGREGGNFSREFYTEPKAVVMQIDPA